MTFNCKSSACKFFVSSNQGSELPNIDNQGFPYKISCVKSTLKKEQYIIGISGCFNEGKHD